ncbi:hypothetical protein [Collimonas silvisoli]|uniref:hypothetical protein n=1 Tax=Collimonas silvisoli TaxID=2825884 RepID=UPI001B8AA04A|nr:hypothetical protein [Collimonas silvisoli]
MKYLKVVPLAGIIFVAHSAIAAPSFDDLKPRLQKIAQCDATEFPATKKQTSDLDRFAKSLRQAGVKAKTIGDGGIEDEVQYRLPSGVTVFGQDVKLIGNYQAPFVKIDFPIARQELVQLITASTGMKLVLNKATDAYELVTKPKLKSEGSKYPFEQNISVSSNGKSGSTYVCNYQNTDPNAG